MRYLLLALILFAAPLSAQQDSTVAIVTINGDTVVVNIDVLIEHNTDPLPDSLLANFERNMQNLRDQLAVREPCNTCGGASTTNKIAVGIVIPVLIWIALELRGIKNKDDIHDVDVEVNVPPRKKKEHGES
jgi:hypothetical protein